VLKVHDKATTDDPWLRSSDAAAYLGISTYWLTRLAADEKSGLVGHKMSDAAKGRWRFKRADLDAWLTRGRKPVGRPKGS
jgi:hypothetical protein